jgi:hypothetical protein
MAVPVRVPYLSWSAKVSSSSSCSSDDRNGGMVEPVQFSTVSVDDCESESREDRDRDKNVSIVMKGAECWGIG